MSRFDNDRLNSIFGLQKIYNQVNQINLKQAKLYEEGQNHIPKTMDIPTDIDARFIRALGEFNDRLNEVYNDTQSVISESLKTFNDDDDSHLGFISLRSDLSKYNNMAIVFETRSLPQQKKDFLMMKVLPLQPKIQDLLLKINILINQVVFKDKTDKDGMPHYLRKLLNIYALYNIILRHLKDRKLKTIDIGDIDSELGRIKGLFGSDIQRLIASLDEIDMPSNLVKILKDVKNEIGRPLTSEEIKKYTMLYDTNIRKSAERDEVLPEPPSGVEPPPRLPPRMQGQPIFRGVPQPLPPNPPSSSTNTTRFTTPANSDIYEEFERAGYPVGDIRQMPDVRQPLPRNRRAVNSGGIPSNIVPNLEEAEFDQWLDSVENRGDPLQRRLDSLMARQGVLRGNGLEKEQLKQLYQRKMRELQMKKNKLNHDAVLPYDPRFGKNVF